MTHFFPEPADAEERELFARVARCDESFEALTPERLREITARDGCDFATALLHRRIVESEAHGPLLRVLGRSCDAPVAGSSGGVPAARAVAARTPRELPAARRRSYVVAIVPGAFHRENPRTGADGHVAREVASQLGLPVIVAPASSTGSLAENARILAGWLPAQGDAPLILVSVSKGGSDVKAALARPDAARVFERVTGWLNLCGILDGTPMADWLLSPHLLARANRFVYRIRGRSLDFLSDMQRYPGCPLDFPLTLPAHLRTVHVVGFPLRRHLRNGLARRCHARLASHGPNDGSILLADTLRWPGQLCPVWGADHYLRPRAGERPLLAALLRNFAK